MTLEENMHILCEVGFNSLVSRSFNKISYIISTITYGSLACEIYHFN